MIKSTVTEKRAYFPRGLYQPEGSFRFSADALLLAAFILRHCLPHTPRPRVMLELGCGCGVISLACLLADKELTSLGVDIVPELAAAANTNAAALGLAARFSAVVADATAPAAQNFSPERYGVLAANPPYYTLGKGRLPRSAMRRKAFFADEKMLPGFIQSAAHALAPGGRFALIYPWEARQVLLEELASAGFFPAVTLPLYTAGVEPSRILYAAARGNTDMVEPVLLPPIRLHPGGVGAYTAEALSFCPWLVS